MSSLVDRVATIVLVILENRSFDHMLGHLTYENLVAGVNGIGQNLGQYKNLYNAGVFSPYQLDPGPRAFDLPHEWNDVEIQLALSSVTGKFTMSGFVQAYAAMTKTNPVGQVDPMGFFASKDVAITSFLARNFCTCDSWHCPLPTSTQPNRTMAFCGSSKIFDTPPMARLIPCDDIILDWLDRAKVRWRVYHDGLSFFSLYPRVWKHVLGDNFRDFEDYFHDMQVEPIDGGPQVVIVEPSYNDAPHIGPDHPNDNHPPLAIGWGEDFLRRVYQAAAVNSERWSKTVMIYYYDEHGGFYDHVPPPMSVTYDTKGNPSHAFKSLGPRIPAVIVSPLVKAGSVCHELFDHTSVLQFLAELFTPGKPYSDDVETRRTQGIASVSVALGDSVRADVPAAPAEPIPVQTALGAGVVPQPRNGLQASFDLAASQLMTTNPQLAGKKYPDLFHWKAAVDAERRRVQI